MNRTQTIFAGIALLLMAGTATVLQHTRDHQRLGEPGIRTQPVPGGRNLELLLPDSLPGYTSQILTNAEAQLLRLPPDTSYRVRMYQAADGFWGQLSVVLMGADRSSIHKPEICMLGQGWTLDQQASQLETLHLTRPTPYELPVNKLVFTKAVTDAGGTPQTVRGLYIYWFVDGHRLTARHHEWKIWMAKDLLLTGELERWAYIAFFTPCAPGQEDAAYDRLKALIAAAVPEFQRVPRPGK